LRLFSFVIGCLHDPANVQFHYNILQHTSSNSRVFWIHLLEVCWTFAGSYKNPISENICMLIICWPNRKLTWRRSSLFVIITTQNATPMCTTDCYKLKLWEELHTLIAIRANELGICCKPDTQRFLLTQPNLDCISGA